MMDEQSHLLHNPYVQDFSAYGVALPQTATTAVLQQSTDPLSGQSDPQKVAAAAAAQYNVPRQQLNYNTSYNNMMLPNGSPASVVSPMYRVPLPSEVVTTGEDEPLYVNAKQYHRILKRRAARAKLEERSRIQRSRKPYLHESRHRHAMRRPRGPGGRFLTAAEIAELDKNKADDQHEDDHSNNSQGN
ncbi:Transcriptional activator [Basidiobolus ranarum]|uniref:Transcriptional activator HAP2 n=1 Tax=Basidiobolus ranarum TaxID=34480 RepID=A0ABR2WW87_9FUNG